MSDKDRKLVMITILMCTLAVVVTLLVVLWPSEAFEVSVKHHASDEQNETTHTTLPFLMTVNINTAQVEDLMLLPGMTRETALKVVKYRFDYCRFETVEEITKVDGVTWELYASWAPYIFI